MIIAAADFWQPALKPFQAYTRVYSSKQSRITVTVTRLCFLTFKYATVYSAARPDHYLVCLAIVLTFINALFTDGILIRITVIRASTPM